MEDLALLNAGKEYDHKETKELLGQVREFFQAKLRIIVPEWVSKKTVAAEEGNNGAVEIFFIPKQEAPIYAECNGYDDLAGILALFDKRLNTLLDHMDSLQDNNAGLDDESKKSLESYASAIYKCVNVYTTQKRKRMPKFKELSTVGEIQEELRQLISEIVSNYIISVLCDALYERIKNNAGLVYEMAVREINTFLAENGIYTKEIKIGEMMDPEYMEPTPDSAGNYTDDFHKFETIDEIRRYPYLFADGCKIADGRAKIWRRKD